MSENSVTSFHEPQGLALAALGFKENWRQLSYLALALPVLQLSLSLVRPDSSEALALRLHKARPVMRLTFAVRSWRRSWWRAQPRSRPKT